VLSGSLDAEYRKQIETGILDELSSLTTPPTRLANGTNAVFRSITAGSVLVQIDVDNEVFSASLCFALAAATSTATNATEWPLLSRLESPILNAADCPPPAGLAPGRDADANNKCYSFLPSRSPSLPPLRASHQSHHRRTPQPLPPSLGLCLGHCRRPPASHRHPFLFPTSAAVAGAAIGGIALLALLALLAVALRRRRAVRKVVTGQGVEICKRRELQVNMEDYMSRDAMPMEDEDPELTINPIIAARVKMERERQRAAKRNRTGGLGTGKSGGLRRLNLGVSKPAESSVDKGRAYEQRQIDQFLGVATPLGADPRGRRPGAPARAAAAAGARPGAAPERFASNRELMSTGI